MVARTPRSETGQQTAAKTARKRKTEGKASARRTRTARRTAEQVFEGLAVSPGVAIGPAHMRESGDMVMVYSDRVPSLKETVLGVEGDDYTFTGQMTAGNIELTTAAVTGVAMVTRHIKKGVVYMDFLDTKQPANSLEGRVVDWISGNYNYKMGVAKVKKIGISPYKHTFRSMSFAPRDIT